MCLDSLLKSIRVLRDEVDTSAYQRQKSRGRLLLQREYRGNSANEQFLIAIARGSSTY